MKDQRRLLNVCLANKIPAFVLQGRDICSIEILKSASEIYERKGCSKEFLYDFRELIRDFLEYQCENQSGIKLSNTNELEISESDKKRLLNECLYNEIPVMVIQGTDACSIEILKSANEIYQRAGCDKEFQYDFQNLINGFSGYQYENHLTVKLPALSEIEKELIQESMFQRTLDIAFKTALEANDFGKLSELKEQGYQPSKKLLQSLVAIPDNTLIAVQQIFKIKIKGVDVSFEDIMVAQPDMNKNAMKPVLQPDMIR